MTAALLFTSVIFLIAALICLLFVLFKNRIWNVHEVWKLAVLGDRLAQLYMALIGLAFVLAVASTVLRLMDGDARKRVDHNQTARVPAISQTK